MLTSALEGAKVTQSPGLIRSIIVPHAGYVYCVETSMHAFAALDPTNYDRVFVLGPSHSMYVSNCTIADATEAECPLGNIPFDVEVCENLLKNHSKLFKKLNVRQAAQEHSLEMEFPLLKFMFKDHPFKIVPIMVGDVSFKGCQDLAKAFEPYSKDTRTLFVISSDFCHWGARFDYTYLPDGDGQIWERIKSLDKQASEMISTGDPNKFYDYLKKTKNTICGRDPILTMMFMYPGMRAEFPSYSQSSHITKKNDSSVSYFAGIIRTD